MIESWCLPSLTRRSVSALTSKAQDGLQANSYAFAMEVIEAPSTPADRVAHAIRASGLTLEQIAEKIRCTHVSTLAFLV